MAFDGASWDETKPDDDVVANQIDDYTLDLKKGLRGRLALEHEFPTSQSATSEAGKHKFITLQNLAAKPTIAGTQVAAVYTKTVGTGLQELFFEDEAGNEIQIVNGTQVNVNFAGHVVQMVSTSYSSVTSGSTTLLYDDSIPQITEGVQMMSLAITPLTDTNKVMIDVGGFFQNNANDYITLALFKGTTAGALAAISSPTQGVIMPTNISLSYVGVPGTTAATTYYVRAGANSGNICMNGIDGTRKMGGVMASYLRILEVKV